MSMDQIATAGWLVTPDSLSAVTEKAWSPSPRPPMMCGLEQAVAVAPSRLHTYDAAPVAENWNSAVALGDGLRGPERMTFAGATVLTVHDVVALSPSAPYASRERTTTECVPSASGPATLHGLVHATAAPPSSEQVCATAVVSLLVNQITALVELVGEGTGEIVGAPDGVLSIRHE